jgi:hypothetical protein
LTIRCSDTSGTIDMTNPRDGVARLTAYALNGHRVSQGVQIHARFLPTSGVQVSELILTLPEVPLVIAGVDKVLGSPITSGRFAGRVQYLHPAEDAEIWIDGRLDEVNLAELTAGVPLGPFHGRASIKVAGARISGSVLTHLRGSAEVAGLALAPFAALLGSPTLSGSASLSVDAIDIAQGRVNRIRLAGVIGDLAIQEWLRPVGRGSASGRLTIRIHNLDLEDERIRSADIEVNLLPAPGRPGTIDRELILGLAEKALDVTWPAALPERLVPERIEYAECGVRLLVRDNRLRVLGTHGRGEDTILTLRLLGQAIPVIKEQTRTIDLTPLLEDTWKRLRAYQAERLRRWFETGRGPAGAG